MEIYLVGGAVRDQLLGLPIKDRDWVVVGATPEQMLALGFRQVGQDFPVFIHPESGEEYALARTERKTGQGHRGFAFEFSDDVSLEADLARRDLTINAIARDEDGQLIDPYDGQRDIEQRWLRHVSPAFSEDPLRVLRLMRFWARFARLGFRIAPETLSLCQSIAARGELASLTAERIWMECEKALAYDAPQQFFMGLAEVGQAALDSVTRGAIAVGDRKICEMNVRLGGCSERGTTAEMRLAVWAWGEEAVIAALKKLPLPNTFRYWLDLVNAHGDTIRQWFSASEEQRWAALNASHSLRKTGDVLALADAVAAGKTEVQEIAAVLARVQAIDPGKWLAQGIKGAELGKAIRRAQLKAVVIQ